MRPRRLCDPDKVMATFLQTLDDDLWPQAFAVGAMKVALHTSSAASRRRHVCGACGAGRLLEYSFYPLELNNQI